MTLLTSATLTLDRLQYTVQIRAVSAQLALLPATNSAHIAIAAGVDVEATPGTSAVLELDGGDGGSVVLTGSVQQVRRTATATNVTIADGSAELAHVRTAKTFNGMLAMQIINELAGQADVSTGLVVATTQTAAYIGDPRRSAAEHIASLAALAGGVASLDADGRLNVLPWPIGLPTAAMRRDREFLALETTMSRAHHQLAAVGAGGPGVALAPDAWVVNTDPVTGADDPSSSLTWTPQPALRTRVDVDLANKSLDARRGAATRELKATCWLQPARRPADVIQIQETSTNDERGPWLVTSITHDLAWDRSISRLRAVSAGSTGDLLNAVGSLGGLL